MSLSCLKKIVTNDLIVNIDLNDSKSWIDYNDQLYVISLNKWKNSVSENINLFDFGLTGFDNGRTNAMWSGITLNDNYLSLYRVGYNDVSNPNTDSTSGITVTTTYLPITGITGTSNYFNLNGGYLQGFFRLQDYNYKLIPSRFANGVSFETILNLDSNSQGIFLMLGARAEDKYNPYFSGETILGLTTSTGVTTSLDNNLDAILGKEQMKKNFRVVEDNKEIVYSQSSQVNNLKNNVIAFELTPDKHLAYKYINNEGHIISNKSERVVTSTGFTLISIVFKPSEPILDLDILDCVKQRKGNLIFYVNGRVIWSIKDFPEFYFHGFENDKEKQLGVPYSMSWGGGSFGLLHSYHYDHQKYDLINENFISSDGLDLIDSTSGMTVTYTGSTDFSGNTYSIEYTLPISVISNRDYKITASIYSDGFFNYHSINSVSILPISIDSDTIITRLVNSETQGEWNEIECVFHSEENIGKTEFKFQLKFESNVEFNLNNALHIKDFSYTAQDILVKDPQKEGLLIEENFNTSFIGGIQKLRIYDNALNSQEILHNAIIESQTNDDILVSKGGRIIYR